MAKLLYKYEGNRLDPSKILSILIVYMDEPLAGPPGLADLCWKWEIGTLDERKVKEFDLTEDQVDAHYTFGKLLLLRDSWERTQAVLSTLIELEKWINSTPEDVLVFIDAV